MLRRDLLKGLLGLVGGGLLLKDLPAKDPEYAAYTIPNYKDVIDGYCRNEFRVRTTGKVNPGDKLYGHVSKTNLPSFTVSTKESNNFFGIALSNKDEYSCCKVALYLK